MILKVGKDWKSASIERMEAHEHQNLLCIKVRKWRILNLRQLLQGVQTISFRPYESAEATQIFILRRRAERSNQNHGTRI